MGDQVGPPLPPVQEEIGSSLIRLYSGVREPTACYCGHVSSRDNVTEVSVRLGCSCLVHLHCLVPYIQAALGNDQLYFEKTQDEKRGIVCPFKKACISKRDVGPDEDALPRSYVLTLADVQAAKSLSEKHVDLLHSQGIEPLSDRDIQIFVRRSVAVIDDPLTVSGSEGGLARVTSESDLGFVLQNTTKACPKCSGRGVRPHGHKCHHVSGCDYKLSDGSICKQQYCFVCLSTAEENIRVRGEEKLCNCINLPWGKVRWTSFCDESSILANIEFGEQADGSVIYPRDKRCGCFICNECSPGNPCIDGCTCLVCKGIVNRGPSSIEELRVWNPRVDPVKPLESAFLKLQETVNTTIAFDFHSAVENTTSIMGKFDNPSEEARVQLESWLQATRTCTVRCSAELSCNDFEMRTEKNAWYLFYDLKILVVATKDLSDERSEPLLKNVLRVIARTARFTEPYMTTLNVAETLKLVIERTLASTDDQKRSELLRIFGIAVYNNCRNGPSTIYFCSGLLEVLMKALAVAPSRSDAAEQLIEAFMRIYETGNRNCLPFFETLGMQEFLMDSKRPIRKAKFYKAVDDLLLKLENVKETDNLVMTFPSLTQADQVVTAVDKFLEMARSNKGRSGIGWVALEGVDRACTLFDKILHESSLHTSTENMIRAIGLIHNCIVDENDAFCENNTGVATRIYRLLSRAIEQNIDDDELVRHAAVAINNHAYGSVLHLMNIESGIGSTLIQALRVRMAFTEDRLKMERAVSQIISAIKTIIRASSGGHFQAIYPEMGEEARLKLIFPDLIDFLNVLNAFDVEVVKSEIRTSVNYCVVVIRNALSVGDGGGSRAQAETEEERQLRELSSMML